MDIYTGEPAAIHEDKILSVNQQSVSQLSDYLQPEELKLVSQPVMPHGVIRVDEDGFSSHNLMRNNFLTAFKGSIIARLQYLLIKREDQLEVLGFHLAASSSSTAWVPMFKKEKKRKALFKFMLLFCAHPPVTLSSLDCIDLKPISTTMSKVFGIVASCYYECLISDALNQTRVLQPKKLYCAHTPCSYKVPSPRRADTR